MIIIERGGKGCRPSSIRRCRWNGGENAVSWFSLAALLFAVFILGRIVLSNWVDLLWFRSLSYGSVFWTTIWLQVIIFAVASLVTFASSVHGVLGNQAVSSRQSADGSRNHHWRATGQVLCRASAAFYFTGRFDCLRADSRFHDGGEWPVLGLFWYAPHATGGATDAIFGKPLNFFLFTLPAWQLINNWLLTLAIATCAVAVLFLFITSGSRTSREAKTQLWPSAVARTLPHDCLSAARVGDDGLSSTAYQTLLEHHTIFDGVNYTDAHVSIPGALILCATLLLGAAIAAVNALRESRGRWLLIAIAPAILCYVVIGIIGWYVGNFIVNPNQLDREEPYIAHNIEATRRAYGLDRFSQSEFPAETTPDAVDAANNQATLQNVRLWDWHALQDTLRQIQEIRTYYDFPDIDIDRYDLNGTTREVMLAARELNVDRLPESSRNWINEKLIYTHGYGVTMNPVNGFTPEGLPILLLSNMPVQSTVPGLKVTRPEIYFGELTDTDVYVKTRQQEFDYPQGQNNTLTSYQGTGGILMGGFARRLLLAIARDDVATLPFSDDVNPQSRMLLWRNIRQRVAKLAPFLTFDQDPYLVVGDDGRLSWVMDAYTTSDSYPYSTHYNLGDNSTNYMRNSVKAVVDAYNGTVTFYVFDSEDPVLATYRRIFPSLFKDAAAMPADLRRHVRYPEALFTLQSEVYGLYHMTNPEVFFNREDLWTVATETATDSEGEQGIQPMQPNFVLMKLPGGTSEEFVEILPFTPANRNNLIGWIAGRCDGANYGTAVVYDFPKTRLIDGPQQIEARIDQNAQLSGQLTLWNQQGSHVLRGSLLVIPSGRALLYAEPIYLQAKQSPMPELRLVVLALQDKLAYGTTFEAALRSLFGGEVSSLNPTEATPAAPPSAGTAAPATDTDALIAEASKDFDDYQRLTAEGKLAEAGQKLEQLKGVLSRLNSHRK